MDKYETILNDLYEILSTIPDVNKVSHGKALALDQEDTFTAVYIGPDLDTFQQTQTGTSSAAYTNTFYIRLDINVDCSSDDLYYIGVRRAIIDTILNDVAIWNNIIDRDLVSVAYDDYQNYPRKAFSILFEFRLRESCSI